MESRVGKRTERAVGQGMLPRRGLRLNAVGLVFCLASLVTATTYSNAAGRAPLFKGRGPDRASVQLEHLLKEGPVLIVFWATCCSNTITMMDHLEALHRRYAEHGFKVLGVAENDSKTVSQVKPWVAARGLTLPIVMDPEGKILRLYQVQATPHLVLVNPERTITFSHTGFMPGDEQVCEEAICSVLGIEYKIVEASGD